MAFSEVSQYTFVEMEYSYNKFHCKIVISLSVVSVLNYIAMSEYRQ